MNSAVPGQSYLIKATNHRCKLSTQSSSSLRPDSQVTLACTRLNTATSLLKNVLYIGKALKVDCKNTLHSRCLKVQRGWTIHGKVIKEKLHSGSLFAKCHAHGSILTQSHVHGSGFYSALLNRNCLGQFRGIRGFRSQMYIEDLF